MGIEDGNVHPTSIRRGDRAMANDEEIIGLLQRSSVCRIATSINDQPYIVARTFWYNNRCIYVHGALQGRLLEHISVNPQVCVEVDWTGRWLSATTAAGFGVEYASAIVFGQARIVSDREDKQHALQGLLDKYFPDKRPSVDYRPIMDVELVNTTVVAIDVEAWSGKEHMAQPSA